MQTVTVKSSLQTVDSWIRYDVFRQRVPQIHNPVTKNVCSKYRFTVPFLQFQTMTMRTWQQHTKFKAAVDNKKRSCVYENEPVLPRIVVVCAKSFSDYY